MGFNCAEAVNFAPPDWLRFGGAACQRYRSFRKPSLLSHEWLLFKVRQSVQTPVNSFALPAFNWFLSLSTTAASASPCCSAKRLLFKVSLHHMSVAKSARLRGM